MSRLRVLPVFNCGWRHLLSAWEAVLERCKRVVSSPLYTRSFFRPIVGSHWAGRHVTATSILYISGLTTIRPNELQILMWRRCGISHDGDTRSQGRGKQPRWTRSAETEEIGKRLCWGLVVTWVGISYHVVSLFSLFIVNFVIFVFFVIFLSSHNIEILYIFCWLFSFLYRKSI